MENVESSGKKREREREIENFICMIFVSILQVWENFGVCRAENWRFKSDTTLFLTGNVEIFPCT